MTKSTRVHGLAAIVLLAMPGAVFADDLDDILNAPELPPTVRIESDEGWYLRGDLSYDLSTDGGATAFRTFDGSTMTYGSRDYSASTIDTDWGAGIGLGYQITDWFRAEAAFDYRPGSLDTASTTSSPCAGGLVDTGCGTAGSADFDSFGVMANAYADLGTFVGVTPYVGAGAGMTLVDYGTYVSEDRCVDGVAVCSASFVATRGHAGQSDWRFTYALTAGLAYAFNRHLKADIGYRYVDVGGGDAYGFDAASLSAGAVGVQGTDDGFSAHQIRFSLRYAF